MEIVTALKALANDRRLQILDWLRHPVRNFPAQVDGDLRTDGVCGCSIADKLGIKPAGWDGADWPKAVFNDAQPPTWFSWTVWALTHPGEPTTGGNILDGAIRSTGTTLALLNPSANKPWKNSSGDDFWSKVGTWLSKLVPGRVF